MYYVNFIGVKCYLFLGFNEKEIKRIAKKYPSFNNNSYSFLFEKYSQLLVIYFHYFPKMIVVIK